MEERVQKVLARAGLASRRTVEQWIGAGRVEVNGAKATLGMVIDPSVDHITVDGRPVSSVEAQKRYVLMNKPVGYTTTLKDRHAQHLVSDLLPSTWGRLYPVGRLDRDTAGLLLMTNDGTLAHRLMHPSFQVPKVYEAWVQGRPGATHLERLRDGIPLDEGMAHAHNLQVVKREADRTLVRLTLTEGMKREVRRIFQVIGHPVLELTRIKYGPLSIEGLEPGRFRPLTHAEVKALQEASRPLEERAINSRRRAIGDERSSRPHHTGRLSLSTPRSRHSVRDTRGNSGRPHR
ncbi:MAG: rRNA pseudouridine synthase [Firmicutes bacterium]|jgi:23S rRNA pseudouridine2605 synthase|nr:rRNA pseudouridine synthase [Bacillota bacterium]